MGKYIQSFAVVAALFIMAFFAAAAEEGEVCGSESAAEKKDYAFESSESGEDHYTEMVEGHPAFRSYKEGVWEIRYLSWTTEYTDRVKSETVWLSVNMNRELSEQEMMEIMDYYEFTRNALFKNGKYVGERETDFTCFAVFFQGESEAAVRKIKYFNGKEEEPSKEEENYFPSPEAYTPEQEIGEWP